MKKIASLLVVLLIFAVGCSKKTQESEFPAESEFILNETVPQAIMDNMEVQAPAPGAVEENIPAAPMVNVPETPTTKDIQRTLKNAGFYQGKIDGVIGPKTKEAIKSFQDQHNLKVDGKVGPKTWTELKSYF